MSPLTHSPFLQALGYSIINSLWQFALLWLVYVLLNTILKLTSRQKYSAGYFLQVCGFIWFIITFTIYFRQYSQLAESYFPLHRSFSFYIVAGNAATIREKIFAWLIQTENFLPYLSLAYLTLLVFMCIRWIKSYNFAQCVRSGGLHTIETNWQLFVTELSARLGIKRKVKIYLSEKVKTPLTIGFFKPFILIPLASLNHLNTDQMEAVILHELAHIKRFDYLFNLFLALIETALFFNPFTILISRQIKRERENCCDDWVLQYNYNAASYAGALLQIAARQSSAPLLALNAADNKQVLLGRIKRMIEKKEKSFFNYRYQLMALLVMITVLSSLALLSSYHAMNNDAFSPLSAKIVSAQIIKKADNQLINQVLLYNYLPEKFNLIKDKLIEKNIKRKLLQKALVAKTIINNKNIERNIKQSGGELIPDEANQLVFSKDSNSFLQEVLAKNAEVSNIRLNEMLAAGVQLKERQIALAEERFKKVAADLFKQNKTFFEQKQFHGQIKAALEQIKAAQIQLELADRAISGSRQNKNNASDNEIAYTLLQLAPQLPLDKRKKINLITSQLQLQIEKVNNQCLELYNSDAILYNNELHLPDQLLCFSSPSKAHTFSFEFSDKPKAKGVLAASVRSYKKAEEMNKVFIERENKPKSRNLLPLIPAESLPKVITGNKSFYVISI